MRDRVMVFRPPAWAQDVLPAVFVTVMQVHDTVAHAIAIINVNPASRRTCWTSDRNEHARRWRPSSRPAPETSTPEAVAIVTGRVGESR